jgi:hypothetical protein
VGLFLFGVGIVIPDRGVALLRPLLHRAFERQFAASGEIEVVTVLQRAIAIQGAEYVKNSLSQRMEKHA